MGNVKMRITIDVESGNIEDVKRVEIIEDKGGPREIITEADDDTFDGKASTEPASLNVTRCHHTTILQTHSSPECVYFHQRGRGWRRVCT